MLDYPHNLEAERCAIGAMIFGEDDQRLTPGHFYHEDHKKLLKAIRGLQSDNIGIDVVTVWERVRRDDGTAIPQHVITQIVSTTPHANHLSHYADIVIGYWRRRRMVEAANWLYRQSSDMTADPDDTWRRIGREVERQKEWSSK